MNRTLKRSLVAAGLGTALALAAPAFATGALPTQLDPIAQAATGTGEAARPTSSTAPSAGSGAPASGDTTPAGATPAGNASSAAPAGAPAPAAQGATSPVPTADAVFDQLDTNKDGMLSREEFARATIRSQ